jgi:hypothetical protein
VSEWRICVGDFRKQEYLTLRDAPVSDGSLVCYVIFDLI